MLSLTRSSHLGGASSRRIDTRGVRWKHLPWVVRAVRYLEVLEHGDSFDEEREETRRDAIHLAVMHYRAGDFAMTPGRLRAYRDR